ncbi:hypothetical protein JCM17380_35000 [Desulfosporosinus burensis]
MFKKAIFIICLLLLALLIWDYLVKPLSLHRHIKLENVSEIMLWSEASGKDLATEEEIKNLVTWFNSASGVRENNSVPGEPPQSVIIIKQMNGKEILISRHAKRFDISRWDEHGRNIVYWTTQKELKNFLDKLAKQ